LEKFNQNKHQLIFISARLLFQTTSLAKGYEVVCCFVNDELDEECIHLLAKQGIKHIVMRCAVYNNVSLETCEKYGINVAGFLVLTLCYNLTAQEENNLESAYLVKVKSNYY
jgi:D-lactate dehydrogenase